MQQVTDLLLNVLVVAMVISNTMLQNVDALTHQKLCAPGEKVCGETGICKVKECSICHRKASVCETTNAENVIPNGLPSARSLLVNYKGPPADLVPDAFVGNIRFVWNFTITGNIISIKPQTFAKMKYLKYKAKYMLAKSRLEN